LTIRSRLIIYIQSCVLVVKCCIDSLKSFRGISNVSTLYGNTNWWQQTPVLSSVLKCTVVL